ncbi:MAG: MBL fold metallo-hydrolase, partial [Bdellovibrionales bacterium]
NHFPESIPAKLELLVSFSFRYIMWRGNFMKRTLCLLGILLHLNAARAGDDFEKEIVKATAITDSIYMLEGAGGNITALIGADGTFLVDDEFAPMAAKLVAKLRELKGDSPRMIVNTHFHYDHTGGNEVFGSTATIIAATAVRDRLETEQTLWHERHPAEPHQALPTVTFDESLNLHLNGENIRVVHLSSGHTDGDSVAFFKNGKVVSMGDLYFAGMFPIFHPEHNGSLDGFIHDIEEVIRLTPSDAKIVPGHGPMTSKAELVNYRRMIRDSVRTVKNGIRAGRSLEQIQKTGLDKRWESYSHGYLTSEKWIALVYSAFQPKKL